MRQRQQQQQQSTINESSNGHSYWALLLVQSLTATHIIPTHEHVLERRLSDILQIATVPARTHAPFTFGSKKGEASTLS